VMITDGSQPIGNGVGPALEARDVLQVLQNDPRAPVDLKEKGLQLAGRILEFDPDVRGGDGYHLARDLLESGRAWKKMQDIISAQGANPEQPGKARLQFDVLAPQAGVVTAIDNLQIAHIARLAGAPMDKTAGIDLRKKRHDDVKKDEVLYTIHAEFHADFEFARTSAARDSGYALGDES